MDRTFQAWDRLREQVLSMTPGARLAAGLAAALVALSVGWFYVERGAGGRVPLMGSQQFSESQVRAIVRAFAKAGLEDYHLDGGRVSVPRGQQSKYVAALADDGALPAEFGAHLRRTVDSGGFMLSGPQQEAQTKIAIQSELQLNISSLQGVEKAFVHIAEDIGRGFQRTKTVTASVGVEPAEGRTIDASMVETIRWMVASAWPGLKPQAVTVVDLGGNRLFAGDGAAGGPAANDPAADYVARKKQLEIDWQEKIGRLLDISGALVTASVEFDSRRQRTRLAAVSVAVPRAHYDQLWRNRHASADASPDAPALAALEQSEARNIQCAIAALLAAGDDAQARITVATMQDQGGAKAAPVPNVPAWLMRHWQSLGVGGLIAVGLLLLRASIRQPRNEAAREGLQQPEEQTSADTLGASEPHAATPRAAIAELRAAVPLDVGEDAAGIELDAPLAGDVGLALGVSGAGQAHAGLRIDDVPSQKLAQFLAQEHPQTIALVLSRMSTERAAAVLSCLEEGVQGDIARRLVDLDQTDTETLLEVERGLAAWLDSQRHVDERQAAGVAALSGILDAADPSARQRILSNLARHDGELAARLEVPAPPAVAFGDLEGMDASCLAVVLRQCEPELLSLAMAGAAPRFAERVLALLTPAAAGALRATLGNLGPTRLSDVEEAQQQLAALAGELELKGEIAPAARGRLSLAA